MIQRKDENFQKIGKYFDFDEIEMRFKFPYQLISKKDKIFENKCNENLETFWELRVCEFFLSWLALLVRLILAGDP
jgi:hypothetical protein